MCFRLVPLPLSPHPLHIPAGGSREEYRPRLVRLTTDGCSHQDVLEDLAPVHLLCGPPESAREHEVQSIGGRVGEGDLRTGG